MIYKDKECVQCKQIFTPNSPKHKFCSDKCKHGTKICCVCEKEFSRKLSTTGRFCSLKCWYASPGKSKLALKQCDNCKLDFQPSRLKQKCCSVECANNIKTTVERNRVCPTCNSPFIACHPRVKFCSHSCALTGRVGRGKQHPIGTKIAGPSGYMLIKLGKGHLCANKNGWGLEHRYLMEQSLNRPLLNTERIHHKNGIRSDNRLENLELWVHAGKKDPSGIRLNDLLDYVAKYCKNEILIRLNDS